MSLASHGMFGDVGSRCVWKVCVPCHAHSDVCGSAWGIIL